MRSHNVIQEELTDIFNYKLNCIIYFINMLQFAERMSKEISRCIKGRFKQKTDDISPTQIHIKSKNAEMALEVHNIKPKTHLNKVVTDRTKHDF